MTESESETQYRHSLTVDILDAKVIFRSDVSLVVGFALSEIRNRESVTVV